MFGMRVGMQFGGLLSEGGRVSSAPAVLRHPRGGARRGADLPAKSSDLPLQPLPTAPATPVPTADRSCSGSDPGSIQINQKTSPKPRFLLSVTCQSPAEGSKEPARAGGFFLRAPWMEGRATGPSGRRPQSWGTVLLLYDGFSWRPWAPLDRSHVPALCCGVTGETRARQDEDPAGMGCRTCRHHPRDIPSPGGLCRAGASGVPVQECWGPGTGVLAALVSVCFFSLTEQTHPCLPAKNPQFIYHCPCTYPRVSGDVAVAGALSLPSSPMSPALQRRQGLRRCFLHPFN